jgi:hypothetical protein
VHDLDWATATELAAAIRARHVSAVRLLAVARVLDEVIGFV